MAFFWMQQIQCETKILWNTRKSQAQAWIKLCLSWSIYSCRSRYQMTGEQNKNINSINSTIVLQTCGKCTRWWWICIRFTSIAGKQFLLPTNQRIKHEIVKIEIKFRTKLLIKSEFCSFFCLFAWNHFKYTYANIFISWFEFDDQLTYITEKERSLLK